MDRKKLLAMVAILALWFVTPVNATDPPPGWVEKIDSDSIRITVTKPPSSSRGPFTFKPPYNTQAVRLTIPADCNGAQHGSDCISYVGYSIWRNSNYHKNSDEMLIFLSVDLNLLSFTTTRSPEQ